MSILSCHIIALVWDWQPKLLWGPGAGVTRLGSLWQWLLSADPCCLRFLAHPRRELPSTLAAHPIPLLSRF